MKLIVPLLLLSALLLPGLAPASAQEAKTRGETKGLLKLPVWVENQDGSFWQDGKRQSFKVFLDEQEVPVKSFQGPRNSTVVLVVFDTVADVARVDEARSALADSFKELGDQYWVGLLRSQDGLTVLQEPTGDLALLAEKIKTIPVSGKAGLLDTIEPVSRLAAAMLGKAGVRLSILYITDSGIGHYRADYLNPVINSSDRGDLSRRFSDRAVQERVSTLAESLAEFTVPVFVLHLLYRGDTLNLAYQSGLERIAAESDGAVAFCRTSEEIRPSLARLFSRIRSQYVLGVEAPATKRSWMKVRVTVQGATGQQAGSVSHSEQVSVKGR